MGCITFCKSSELSCESFAKGAVRVATTGGCRILSVAVACALALGGSSAIVGAYAAAPQAMGNAAYAKTYKGTDDSLTYKSVSSKSVKVVKCTAKKKSTIEVVGRVKFKKADKGMTKAYYVKGIAPKALKGAKAKTLVVYSTKFTKSNVKNCLKGSKVTRVKVPEKVLKKYRKYFSKKNCGRDVEVTVNWDYSKTVEKLAMPLG